jgi:hypothetical protein
MRRGRLVILFLTRMRFFLFLLLLAFLFFLMLAFVAFRSCWLFIGGTSFIPRNS